MGIGIFSVHVEFSKNSAFLLVFLIIRQVQASTRTSLGLWVVLSYQIYDHICHIRYNQYVLSHIYIYHIRLFKLLCSVVFLYNWAEDKIFFVEILKPALKNFVNALVNLPLTKETSLSSNLGFIEGQYRAL